MRISDWSSDVCSSDLIDEAKLDDDVRAHLGNAVRVHPKLDFVNGLAGLSGKTVVVDPASAVTAIFERLEQAGAKLVEARDPAVLPKAVKDRKSTRLNSSH